MLKFMIEWNHKAPRLYRLNLIVTFDVVQRLFPPIAPRLNRTCNQQRLLFLIDCDWDSCSDFVCISINTSANAGDRRFNDFSLGRRQRRKCAMNIILREKKSGSKQLHKAFL